MSAEAPVAATAPAAPLPPGTGPSTTVVPARWPSTAGRRGVLRLVWSLPFVALVVGAHAAGAGPAASEVLARSADAAFAADTPFGGVQDGYPPLAVLVAALPGGALAVDLAAALVGGAAVHAVAERLLRRQVPPPAVVLLVLTVLAVVLAGLAGGVDPAALVALCLLVVALDGTVRFASAGDTHGGFVAGLVLAAAVLTDAAVLPFVLALGLASPLVARQRYRGVRHAGAATAAVLLFPSLAALASWTFLEWRFSGGARLLPDVLAGLGPATVAPLLLAAVPVVVVTLAQAPLYLAVGVMLASRRPLALLAYGLAPVGLALTGLLGPVWDVGRGLALLCLVAVMTVPARPRRHQRLLLVAVCLVQLLVVLARPAG